MIVLVYLLLLVTLSFNVHVTNSYFTNNPIINSNVFNSSKHRPTGISLFMVRNTSSIGNYNNNSNGNNSNRRKQFQSNARSLLTTTNSLIFVNCLMFLLQKVIPGFTKKFIKYDALIARGQTYRLLSATFLHGSAMHLLSNLYSLYQIGPQAERTFGSMQFLSLYVFSGLLGNTITFLCKSSPMALGASGSIFGLIGAYAIFYYRNKDLLGSRATMGLESIKRTLMINLFYGAASTGIDNFGHAFGFVSGSIYAYLAGPRLVLVKYPYSVSGYRVIDKPIINFRLMWKKFMTAGVDSNGVSSTDTYREPDIFDQINSRNRNRRIY